MKKSTKISRRSAAPLPTAQSAAIAQLKAFRLSLSTSAQGGTRATIELSTAFRESL
jgi:hypothetical protein